MTRRAQSGVDSDDASATLAGLSLIQALGGSDGESVVAERLEQIAEAEREANARLGDRDAELVRRERQAAQSIEQLKELRRRIEGLIDEALGAE